ncbi:class I SAM-dependent methyltransferase [Chloroflexota bacterium]|nr:class I SAM-dependent methyltransferase [Chloroflexota bacterium]
MAKFDHFSFIGPIYDHIFGRHEDLELLAIAKPAPEDRVLDVGGGTGRVSILFQPKVQSVVVSDSAIGMVRMAQERGLCTVVSHAEKLPYAAGQFDRVIMVDAFHHVADQLTTLDEMWRMTAPGGQIIIEEPDIQNFFVKLIALVEKLLLMRSHFVRPEVIAELGTRHRAAEVVIERRNGNAWIIITKSVDPEERS